MSILCLWDIQLTFDRNGVGTYGAYHHKSAAIGYNFFLNPPKFAVVIAILEPANSTQTDNSYPHAHDLTLSVPLYKLD